MPVFRRTKRWLLLLTGLLLSSILLAACGENSPSILDTHGPVAANESFVFWVILAIASIIFVFVEGWLIFAIVRYRGRPDSPNPRQIHGNMKIEIIWT
ncbi:MAG TPA: cytochrome c oxidase subunit II transmembrane domain-containing protein, partial [Ktedonobacteraceae bacterium]|nr:cytochrome c oxidase subunit II transmembrane domain-containing protein [Ktedonobacteraceae bacterium]